MHQIRNPRVQNKVAQIPNQPRNASTLTEVLVALMITSIGLVSVATMFPLSILRSIKATQLTSATEVNYNAVTAIDMYPDMIQHPASRNPTYIFNAANNNTALVDPPSAQNYVIDPLGYVAISNLNLTIGNSAIVHQNRPEHWFGNDASNGVALNGNTAQWPNTPPGNPFVDTTNSLIGYGVARYPMNWRTLAQAHYLVTLPDSWLLQYDTVGGTLGTDNNAPGSQFTQITLNGLSYPTTTPPAPPLRIVMFSSDGQMCQTRNVTAINGSTVLWTEDIDGAGPNASTTNGTDPRDLNFNHSIDHYPLPLSFTTAGIGVVRLEAQDPRYTWLLTVRQPNPPTVPRSAGVDVVVFFNRSMENIGTDEVLYQAGFTIGSPQVHVTYPTGTNPSTGQPLKPFMKKGGFVFDANNAYWYRISNVADPDPTNPVPGSAQLTLDVPANASNTNLTNPNTGNLIPPRAMFPRNIVDVFPLGSKP